MVRASSASGMEKIDRRLGHEDSMRQTGKRIVRRWRLGHEGSLSQNGPTHHLAIYFANGGLSDIDAELEKLAVNPWCAPQWVGVTDLANELTDFQRDLWTATARS